MPSGFPVKTLLTVLHTVFRNSIFPVLQKTFVLMLKKDLVTSKSQQTLKTLNLYWILSLGLLMEIGSMAKGLLMSGCKRDCSNVLHLIEIMLIVHFQMPRWKNYFQE